MPNKFVILTTQRSGSTWLVDVLDKCENTAVYGELFLPEKMKWQAGSTDHPQFFEAKDTGRRIRPFSTFDYLNHLYNKPGTIGFKLMYSNLRKYPEILAYIFWKRIHVIHLIRKNTLNVQISAKIAQTRNQWHITSTEGQPNLTQIHLDPDILLAGMKRLQKKVKTIQNLLHWSRQPHLEVIYESLLETPPDFKSIWNFLSLIPPDNALQSSFTKIRQNNYKEEISNYDEIKKTLLSTEFSALID
jgi:LPS sulfotransferase NodH